MRPIVVSHRTNRGTAAENTLAGIEMALHDGAGAVEVDVRATRDGELVLMHDASLFRTTGDPRFLNEVSADELSRLTARGPRNAPGGTVPRLSEAMALTAGRAVLVVELKEAGLEDRIAALLTLAPPSLEVWIWSFDSVAAYRARQSLPAGVPVSLIARPVDVQERGTDDVIGEARACRLDGLVFESCQLSAERVELTRRAGLDVHAGTSNTRAELRAAAAAGVTAVCTDYTALAVDVLGRSRQPAPGTPQRAMERVAE